MPSCPLSFLFSLPLLLSLDRQIEPRATHSFFPLPGDKQKIKKSKGQRTSAVRSEASGGMTYHR